MIPVGVVLDSTGCTSNDQCSPHGTCTAGVARRLRCVCNFGYVGDGLHCYSNEISPNATVYKLILLCFLDINECLGSTSPCSSHATCTDNEGSFSCSCLPGYSGDGLLNGSGCSSMYSSIL